jgi:hypothetical protein
MNPGEGKSCLQKGYVHREGSLRRLAENQDRKITGEQRSVFQRHHRSIAPAQSSDMLESAVGLFEQQHRTIAEHRMSTFRHVPHTALARMMCDGPIDRRQ